jgi:serine/threonine protein kinase
MANRPPLIVPEMAQSSDRVDPPLKGTTPAPSWTSRLFSRTGLLIALPALVLLAGIVQVIVGQVGLRNTTEASLRQRVTDQTVFISQSTITCLGQAPALLELVRSKVLEHGGTDPASFAPFARALLSHRQGVTYISFSGTDGSFRGVFIDHENGEAIRLNHSWIEPDGSTTRRISDFTGDGALKTAETRLDTGYDPRKRRFYIPALATVGPVWTDPYAFYAGGQYGITCAMAVKDPATNAPLGVATVDFDLATLSAALSLLTRDEPAGEIAFLFTPSGDRIASSGDLHDPAQRNERINVVNAIIRQLPGAGETRFIDLAGKGLPLLVGVHGFQVPNGPLWFASVRAPREALAAEADAELRRSFGVGAVSLAVSVALAALLANYLARQRRIVSDARAAADAAKERLRSMGSYTLVRQLGAGGMGTVWQAEHRMLARPAALKLINPQVLGHTSEAQLHMRARFEREAKATASLRSRNTVTLFDYGVAGDGSFYYAMELLDGVDLHELVSQFGAQPPGRVVQILMQACASLGEAHQHGMVHRDIKPANIYLCRLGLDVDVVKVLDFGLVSERAQDPHLTAAGTVHGTPAFMAPEQAQGHAIDGRADLYAIGCVAYWLLTGRLVFEKRDGMAMMLAHVNVPPPPIAVASGQRIPAGLAKLIMRMLAKDPGQRPADAIEVIAALRDLPSDPEPDWSPSLAEQWWRLHRAPGAPVAASPAAVASTIHQPQVGQSA